MMWPSQLSCLGSLVGNGSAIHVGSQGALKMTALGELCCVVFSFCYVVLSCLAFLGHYPCSSTFDAVIDRGVALGGYPNLYVDVHVYPHFLHHSTCVNYLMPKSIKLYKPAPTCSPTMPTSTFYMYVHVVLTSLPF